MSSNTFICIIAVLILGAISASAQFTRTECTTPTQDRGSCIHLKECASLYNLLKKKPLSDEERQFLARSQCGLDKGNILVCCSDPATEQNVQGLTGRSSSTPSICGEQASCIELQNCAFLFNMLRKKPLLDEDRAFLKRHQCGSSNGKVLVCCRNEYIGAQQPNAIAHGLLPKPGVCGSDMSNRIFGGSVAKINEFPWMAQILYNKLGPRCGGSLINDRYVLTAAHCIRPRLQNEIWEVTRVRLGEWDTSTDRDCEKDTRGVLVCADRHVDIPIENTITHPNYAPTASSRSVPADISLIRLSRSVMPYTDFIRPICLPIIDNLRGLSFDGIAMDVAGWGLMENNRTSNLKMKAVVRGVPLRGCQLLYGRMFSVQLENSQLCAGGERGIDACTGDSGGTLVALDASNKSLMYYYAAGVISFGPTPCGLEGWPGVYTRVTSFIDWILQSIHP